MKHGNVNNRSRNLTPQELRDLTMPPEAVKAANDEHDRRYGFKPGEGQGYSHFAWVPGFCVASPKLDRESIWAHHRAIGP